MSPPPVPPPNRPAARAPRDAQSGVGRPGGILIAAITGAIVFLIGSWLLPQHEPPAPPAPPPAPAPPPPPPTPATTTVDGAISAPADGSIPTTTPAGAAPHDGQTDRGNPSDAAAAHPDLAPTPTPTKEPKEADEGLPRAAPADKPGGGGEEERPADKDLAREAWRRNRPDVSTDGNKASILIPLKGSIAGAGFRVTNRPHAVLVTLPKAASLITMRVYRVNHDGFRLLWINQAEKDANPQDGTSLKLGLSDLGDPLVEIKDDFVRVTVRRPTAGTAAPDRAPAPEHTPAPDHGAAPEHTPVPEHPPEHAPAPEHATSPKPPSHGDAD